MKTSTITLMLLMTVVLLSGCATGITVEVSAIADNNHKPNGTRYLLLNGNVSGQEDDLFFREFSAYFTQILARRGYKRVMDRQMADIEIVFRYNMSDGRTGINTFHHPVYAAVGGNTIRFTETKTDDSGTTTTTTGTVHIPITYQYVGTATESHSYTLFTSSARLEAYALKGQASSDTRTILWTTLLSSTSDSSDLRHIMPFLAVAAEPYLGNNSGKQKTVQIKYDDPKIAAIRKTPTRAETRQTETTQ